MNVLDRLHNVSPLMVDVMLTVCMAAISFLPIQRYKDIGPIRGFIPSALIMLLCASTVMLWRRFPVVTMVGGLAGSFVNGDITIIPLAFLGIGCYASHPEIYAVAAMVVYPLVRMPWESGTAGLVFSVWVSAFVIIFPVITGVVVRRTRELRQHTEQKMEKMRESIDYAIRYAVTEERTRLAFEIHDGLGHQLSVLTIQAGIVQVSQKDPETLQAAAAEIPEAAQRAVHEMHLILSSLRGALSLSAPQDSAATTRIEFISTLIKNLQTSGVDVEYITRGTPYDVPAETSHLVYRVVQEGLTNAVKHATGTHIRVTLEFLTHRIDVSVHNSRPEGVLLDIRSGGTGLTSLRKRLEAAGGNLSSLSTREGGFLLKAALPAAGAVKASPGR
ncbi:histidine kinase [Streptomyces olivoreticuli]